MKLETADGATTMTEQPGVQELAPEHVIETRGLARSFGRLEAVRGVDLAVPRGAVYGLLGLNGAGKSTTIRMLMGLIRRDGGSARVLGLDPARARDAVAIKRRVGYVAETPAFYDWMTVGDLCAFVAHYRRGKWDGRRADDLIHRFRLPRDASTINDNHHIIKWPDYKSQLGYGFP